MDILSAPPSPPSIAIPGGLSVRLYQMMSSRFKRRQGISWRNAETEFSGFREGKVLNENMAFLVNDLIDQFRRSDKVWPRNRTVWRDERLPHFGRMGKRTVPKLSTLIEWGIRVIINWEWSKINLLVIFSIQRDLWSVLEKLIGLGRQPARLEEEMLGWRPIGHGGGGWGGTAMESGSS